MYEYKFINGLLINHLSAKGETPLKNVKIL